ncbi:hypothetical protein CARN8_2660012 [mine drainage metagenome]|uniref:Uncharacterized protein n=1 Tax=mine drainage metagenome TaxID=410659 RepID=A0A3P3ZN89_9ZZZZ
MPAFSSLTFFIQHRFISFVSIHYPKISGRLREALLTLMTWYRVLLFLAWSLKICSLFLGELLSEYLSRPFSGCPFRFFRLFCVLQWWLQKQWIPEKVGL